MCVQCKINDILYASLWSSAGDLIVRRLKKKKKNDCGQLSQNCISAPPLLHIFHTMLQHSWPDDIISSPSCSDKVTYVKPALTLPITDTRTAWTSAPNRRRMSQRPPSLSLMTGSSWTRFDGRTLSELQISSQTAHVAELQQFYMHQVQSSRRKYFTLTLLLLSVFCEARKKKKNLIWLAIIENTTTWELLWSHSGHRGGRKKREEQWGRGMDWPERSSCWGHPNPEKVWYCFSCLGDHLASTSGPTYKGLIKKCREQVDGAKEAKCQVCSLCQHYMSLWLLPPTSRGAINNFYFVNFSTF